MLAFLAQHHWWTPKISSIVSLYRLSVIDIDYGLLLFELKMVLMLHLKQLMLQVAVILIHQSRLLALGLLISSLRLLILA